MQEEQESPSNDSAPSGVERRGFRFMLKHLLIAVAVIAVLLVIWVGNFRKAVTVRASTASDPVRESYFGFDNDNAEARNILVVEGGFTKGTWLSASLSAVQSGVEEWGQRNGARGMGDRGMWARGMWARGMGASVDQQPSAGLNLGLLSECLVG